jgi:hypothetical protein
VHYVDTMTASENKSAKTDKKLTSNGESVGTHISVELLTPELEAAYLRFWESASASNQSVQAYHHLAFRDVVLPELGDLSAPRYWVIVDRSNSSQPAILAALPCFIKNSEYGSAYCSLPYFGPNAGVIVSSRDPMTDIWHKLLIEAALEDAKSSGAISFVIYSPLTDDHVDSYRNYLPNDVVEIERITQTSDLTPPFQLNAKILRDVKRGVDAGFEVSRNEPIMIDELWTIYRDRCEVIGIPYKSKNLVTKLTTEFVEKGLADYYVARSADRNEFVAGLIVLKALKTASYYLPAFDINYRRSQPMALLLSTAMTDLSNEGISLWNWDGSPSVTHPVYAYKRRWGSQHSTYRIYVSMLKPVSSLKSIGVDNLMSTLEYFYVVPFSELGKI